MDLVNEIRKNFARSVNGMALKLAGFDEKFSSWSIKLDDKYAVGIEIDSTININESFYNVTLFTDWFTIGEENKYLLLLASSESSLRHEFAGICALFLEMGEGNSNRVSLLNNPIKWWENWRELLGNKKVDRTVHGVLGELVSLYYIKKNLDPHNLISIDNWVGPSGATIDIRGTNRNYEVKSSIIKYNNIVTISGQFQLQMDTNPLSMIFVRLENIQTNYNENGDLINIDIMIEKLSDLGIDKEELEFILIKLGFKNNSLDRKKLFRFLEAREYIVNRDFPRLNKRNLSNFEHVLQVIFKIDLTGLEYRELDINL
jgi:hypothetical protein